MISKRILTIISNSCSFYPYIKQSLMSLLKKRNMVNLNIPQLQSEGSYFKKPMNRDDGLPVNESIDFGDMVAKTDGTLRFSEDYPIVTLSDLQIHELIGKGSSGMVYRVTHLPSNNEYRDFALKSIAIQDKTSLQKTVDEIHSLKDLKHKNVVQLYTAFYQRKHIHILMDYIDGGSVGDYIQYIPSIPENALGSITYQCIQGLLYIKEKHYLHRDLKPSNILLSKEDGVVKIADFGVARQLRSTTDVTLSVIGTTCYMSPERIKNEEYGLKSDVWSLGVLLYQCAVGKFPFGGQYAKYWNVNFDSQEDFAVELPPNYSKEFKEFLTLCLQIDPKKRASIEELGMLPWVMQFRDKGIDALKSWVREADKLRKESKLSKLVSKGSTI